VSVHAGRPDRVANVGVPLVSAQELVKHFPLRRGISGVRVSDIVHAVDGVSFEFWPRETLGLVGESGSGKSTLARLVMRLIDPTSGRVLYDGDDVTRWSRRRLRPVRRQVQMIFQDPQSSLNPRRPVGAIIAEPLRIHGIGTERERRLRVQELMERVGLNPEHVNRYQHEFSGGQRQRIGIARALATVPKLVVADEPVSALDVSIQAQILNLLEDLQTEFGLAFLFIAHDLRVVQHVSERIAVMYLGKIVEEAPADQLYERPIHPYTEALLSAIPSPDPDAPARRRIVLRGDVPSPVRPPAACRFHTRCRYATEICRTVEPPLVSYGGGHLAACHHPLNVGGVPPFAASGGSRGTQTLPAAA
jgi:peptide/nickel transport system ATP-binding protein